MRGSYTRFIFFRSSTNSTTWTPKTTAATDSDARKVSSDTPCWFWAEPVVLLIAWATEVGAGWADVEGEGEEEEEEEEEGEDEEEGVADDAIADSAVDIADERTSLPVVAED